MKRPPTRDTYRWADWDTALTEAQAAKWLTKAKAITVAGRNVIATHPRRHTF